MVAAESQQRHSLERQVQTLMAFLVPYFFVVTGTKVELAALATLPVLGMLAVITLLAVIGKLVGCGLGAWSLGKKPALLVGVGMVPRGEVGIIVASLGQQAGVFTGTTYALIIAMSLLTSVIAPPFLKALLADLPTTKDTDATLASMPDAACDEAANSQLFIVEETGHNER